MFILKSQLGILTAESDFTLEVEAPVGRVLIGPILDVVAVGEAVRFELGTITDESCQRLTVDFVASAQIDLLEGSLKTRRKAIFFWLP